jgi:RNA polymerase sigma-70 factor (ECF subfamily)
METMPPTARPPTADALLAHAEWIRALARSLVRDPDTADEIAQRTLVAAWTRPPRGPGSQRGWLARCIRNFALGARRSSARRDRSEALAARHEVLPSAHDVVERASSSRELAEHVLALDEPYRTAILLRYFDEKEPSEIGRELGVPAATVRTRVARGLAQLRERLDRRHGGREAWSALFFPLTRPGAPTPFLPAILAMNTSLKIAVPVVLGIAALAYYAQRSGPARTAPEVATAATRPGAELVAAPDPGTTTLASVQAQARRTSQEALPARPAPEPLAIRTMAVRGRVLDHDGRPRANVPLTTSLATPRTAAGVAASRGSTEPPAAVSAADGSFTIPGPLGACWVRANDPELATVLAGLHGDSADEGELVIVVAAALLGEGFVTDDAGNPLEGVHVYVDLPDDLRGRFDVPLDRSTEERCETRTDAGGSFTLERVPRVFDARLVAERDGYERWTSRLDEIPGIPIAITLLRPGTKARVVAGRVVDAGGQPVEGAYVAFGARTMRSEEDGSFRFALDDLRGINQRPGFAPLALRAACKGFLPASYEPPLEGGKPRWPAFVELQLGGPTLAIEGKVLDHEGKARAGLKVWLVDSTTFGDVGHEPVQLETLLAGSEQAFWRFVETDDDGRFRIEGLLDRAYTIEAMEPETLLRTQEKDVPAGTTGVVVRMPEDALFPRVAGVVRGHDGRGIGGATIGPMCDAFRVQWQGHVLGTSHDGLEGVRTDEDGRFELRNVPRSLVYLRIDGEGILPLEYGRYVEGSERFARTEVRELPLDRIETLEIVVDRRAHVQVELGDPASADEFALLDDEGSELEMSAFSGNGRREGLRQPIRAGRSEVVAGTDRARALVLFKGGLEVARIPVELVPGETRNVRP